MHELKSQLYSNTNSTSINQLQKDSTVQTKKNDHKILMSDVQHVGGQRRPYDT